GRPPLRSRDRGAARGRARGRPCPSGADGVGCPPVRRPRLRRSLGAGRGHHRVVSTAFDVDRSDRDAPDRITGIRRKLEGIIGVPATEGNLVEVLRNGNQIFPAMLEAIAGAEHTIDLLTFVYWRGEIGTAFAEALSERARSGVRVRVLLDAWGAHTLDRVSIDMMEDAGVRVRWFRPLHRLRPSAANHRTHRKVMIVDEQIGFTGGVGLARGLNGGR